MHDETQPGAPQPSIERRLATIMMADVFGYSRMMGENEERTVEILRGHRAVFEELLKAHRGRVFNTAGDAILAEFPSAVEAVRCATEIQTALRTRNEHLPEAQRMWFRIGINLGDVIVQGGDLLGDGVNVAARIQAIAEPGGVCISGSVYDQIQNKLTLHFRQLGEKSFKNIAQPVRTFSITNDAAAPLPAGLRWRAARKGPMVIAAGVLIALIAAGAGGYWLYRDSAQRAAEEARRAEQAQRAAERERKSEQERTAAAAAEKEAKLLAELQAAKEALTQADASKRKAEQERLAAEAAQREARLQAELRSAKDAQQRAEAIERKAEEDRKAAAEALRAAAAASEATAKAAEARALETKAVEPRAASKTAAAPAQPVAAAAGKGVERFDGAYAGRMCTLNADGSPRCWAISLQVQKGALSATWTTRFQNQPGHVKGTISPEGEVKMELDAYNPRGVPLSGAASGSWADNKISVSGSWSNKVPVDATWTWAAADPNAAVGPHSSAKESDDSGGFTGRGRGRSR